MKETIWKYFDVFLIYSMSAFVERAPHSNKHLPPRLWEPKIKWAPRALTRVYTVFKYGQSLQDAEGDGYLEVRRYYISKYFVFDHYDPR